MAPPATWRRPARDDRARRRLRGARPRSSQSAGSTHRPLSDGRRCPGRAHVERSVRRRLPDHGLQGVPRHEPGRRDAPAHTRDHLDELHRHDRRQRHHLLLQGVRGQRGQRGPALERGVRDPRRSHRPECASRHRRQLQPTQREPALGRGEMVERDHRRRGRPPRHLEPARLRGDHDLHGPAQQRSVRPRRRGLRAPEHPARREQSAPPVRASCRCRHSTGGCCGRIS